MQLKRSPKDMVLSDRFGGRRAHPRTQLFLGRCVAVVVAPKSITVSSTTCPWPDRVEDLGAT
jgi:hypothetical protein